MYVGLKIGSVSVLLILISNEFHNEIVLGTKECRKEFVFAKVEGKQFYSDWVQKWKEGKR